MAHSHRFTNQLISEDSPYLRQHAHNPIDWYPWGKEAFDKALKEDKLIFLSIGYSTCHWCHVMERESFENEEVASYMNAHYVNIKVDREELPHVDRYFQDVYILLNKRSGGWPLTIIMTPDRKPFFAATYLPPFNRHGRPGLLGMAQYLYETFRDKRENVYQSADSIVAAMQKTTDTKELSFYKNQDASKMIDIFVKGVASRYDTQYKGIGDAPKFPHASTLQTLLNIYRLNHNNKALHYVTQTLEAMAKGGIYDQIEGGFYRYSVDAMWRIPHFEKMLYTNAELIEVYSQAYQLTQNPLFKEVVAQTVHNLETRFYHEGLYFSASDADSDAEEGKYFVLEYTEAKAALETNGFTKAQSDAILAYWHITPEGNFEGKNNPYVTEESRPERLDEARAILQKVREQTEYPFIDYKIQTSWNALLAKALLKAASIDMTYAHKAIALLKTLMEKLYVNSELYHQIVFPNPPKVKAYLEDYAFLIDALLAAYSLTLDQHYFNDAKHLAQKAKIKFYRSKCWYMSDDDFKAEASLYDASYRSALAVILQNFLQLSILQESQQNYNDIEVMLEEYLPQILSNPLSFPTLMDAYLQKIYGWSVIKGKRDVLLHNQSLINSVRFPYVTIKAQARDDFVACKIDRCFAHTKKIEDIIKNIE